MSIGLLCLPSRRGAGALLNPFSPDLPPSTHGQDRLYWLNQKRAQKRSYIRRLEVRETTVDAWIQRFETKHFAGLMDKSSAQQGLLQDQRLPPIPVEVLGAAKGRQYTSEELARACAQAVFPRTTNQDGCVTLHRDHCSVAAGLPRTQVLLWVAGTQLWAAFDHVILAEYHCRYDGRDRRVKDVRQGLFHSTRLASPQGILLALTPHDSLVVSRTRARRRAPTRPPTPQ
jgi:hypothetical protein